MTRSGYKYVYPETDRHGKTRYRFRRDGVSMYFKAKLGTKEFHDQYSDALKLRAKPVRKRHTEKSIDALISAYLSSKTFTGHSKSTKYNYKRILKNFSPDFGHMSALIFEPRHIRKIMHDRQDTPDAANRLLSVLNILFKLAIQMGWRDDNPCTNVDNYKTKKKGFPAWSHSELSQYLSYWPDGTQQRLALLLLYYTGQRSGDVYLFGCGDIVDGNKIRIIQAKTKAKLLVPLHVDLLKVLTPLIHQDVFLQTSLDRPFTSAKSFQQWFVKSAKAAGIQGKSAHGLRKSLLSHLIDAGASERQAMAIGGHVTPAMVSHYTRSADQERLAKSGMERLESILTKGEQIKNAP